LVMVWFAIQNVYDVSLGLGKPNHSQNSFIMMFTLDILSNRRFSKMFLSTWTYITIMWGSIAIKATSRLGHVVTLFFLLRANLVTTYCFKSKMILKSWPKVRVCLFSNNCLRIQPYYLGSTCAPLYHYFIFRIFIDVF
jgi:hypothetical protein